MLTFLITLLSVVIASIFAYIWGYNARLDDEHDMEKEKFHTEEEPESPPWEVNFIDYVIRHAYWSARTFGPFDAELDAKRLTNHIRKELNEIEQHPQDCEEWIDVIILALDGALRVGHSAYTIVSTLKRKQEKNMARKWVIPTDPTTPIEHDRNRDCDAVHPHVHTYIDGSMKFHGRSNLHHIYGVDERETNP